MRACFQPSPLLHYPEHHIDPAGKFSSLAANTYPQDSTFLATSKPCLRHRLCQPEHPSALAKRIDLPLLLRSSRPVLNDCNELRS